MKIPTMKEIARALDQEARQGIVSKVEASRPAWDIPPEPKDEPAIPGDIADPTHPAHYDGVECLNAIRASMPSNAYSGFLKGTIQRYLWRYERKGGVEDLKKAARYLEWLIEHEDVSSARGV